MPDFIWSTPMLISPTGKPIGNNLTAITFRFSYYMQLTLTAKAATHSFNFIKITTDFIPAPNDSKPEISFPFLHLSRNYLYL